MVSARLRLCACLLLVVLARGNSPMPAGDQQSENYDPETDGRGNSTEGFGDMMSPHQNDTEAEVQMCQAKEMKDEAGVTMYHDNGDVMMAPDSSMCEQGYECDCSPCHNMHDANSFNNMYNDNGGTYT